MATHEKQGLDVSIVMPCLNEEATLPTAIEWASEALEQLKGQGLTGEIVVSDNGSTDRSIAIAGEMGARVAHCPARGYGNALIHGCRAAQGRYIVMGDSDASYDFREAVPMIAKLREGYDLCMGNRFKGRIMPGAMPWKNRHIGNPLLSGILNLFFRSGLGDAHCGLRAFTREAFDRMRLRSSGMEFASEMVVKAALLNLRRTEVPITLHKDLRDRPPHLKPFRDGWRHLKFLFMFSPLWLYFVPSTLLLLFSALIFAALLSTKRDAVFFVGPLWFGDHWMILAGGLASIGFNGWIMGLAALVYSVREHFRPLTPRVRFLCSLITVENSLIASVACLVASSAIFAWVLISWSHSNFGTLSRTREMVLATTLLVMGIQCAFGGFLITFVGEDSFPATREANHKDNTGSHSP